MIELYKKCPSCGHINPETEIFCQNPACGGTDISLVRVESPSSPGDNTASAPASPPSQTKQVKVCPQCGGQNETFAILCIHENCGAMLDDVPISQISQTTIPASGGSPSPAPPRLWLIIGNESHECRDGDVLGRSGTLACHAFQEIKTVSGRHVALELRETGWFVVNLPPQAGRAGKNATTLDDCDLGIGDARPLSGEHVLKMSSQCEVKLRVDR